jgi:signal peptidase I
MRRALTVGGALTVAVCALGWLFLAPARLGGRTTYVVTHGTSMEPRFHTGDLAVLYARSSYHVGDIVAYRSATLHTVVMHRIVGEQAGLFTFKGDNNSWDDPDHPTQAAILGRLAVHVPTGGRYLDVLHTTQGRAAAGAVLAFLLLGGTTRARRRRALRTSGRRGGRHGKGRHRASRPPSRRHAGRRARDPRPDTGRTIVLPELLSARGTAAMARPSGLAVLRADPPADPRQRRMPNRAPRIAPGQLAIAILVLVACAAGELWLAKLPTTMATTRTAVVNQTGTFSYSATAPSSVVYPAGKVTTADPIFTQIVHQVDFSFDYATDASMNGTLALTAALVGPSGWTTPLGTGPVASVRDGKGVATVSVDLATAQAALDQFTTATGVKAASTALVITPAVKVVGATAGHPISGTFTGNLTMSDTADQLVVASSEPASSSSGSASDGAKAPNPLVTSSPLDVKVASNRPRTVPVLGHHISVTVARIALGVLVLATICWVLAMLIGSRDAGRAEDDVISALRQYGDRIVDAESIPLEGPIVELTSLAALHSVAERYDRVILHTVRGERHSYVVRDELSWYRYDVRPARGAHAAARRPAREGTVAVEGSVISLDSRLPSLSAADILPGGVGAAAWVTADGYSRAS